MCPEGTDLIGIHLAASGRPGEGRVHRAPPGRYSLGPTPNSPGWLMACLNHRGGGTRMRTAFSRAIPGKKNGSLLAIMGFLVAGMLLLSLTAMISALLIGQQTQGLAAAVNQSGTLRMQSYRIGMALVVGSHGVDENAASADRLGTEFMVLLSDPKLTGMIPEADNDPIRDAYVRVQDRWEKELLPAVRLGAVQAYLGGVDDFVDDIHALVGLIETRAEVYIDRLLTIQVFTLSLTVLSAMLGLLLLQSKVVRPLQSLLALAERARTGDFSLRTPYAGEDELGRLGNAMNPVSYTHLTLPTTPY